MTIKIGIQRVGKVDSSILKLLSEELPKIFKNAVVDVIDVVIDPPRSAYDVHRKQWLSPLILNCLGACSHHKAYARILGVADLDAYVPGLNFVFGEAQLYGKFCIIYLPRLRFFINTLAKDPLQVFYERVVKEAVHELGHTFGLKHCSKPTCVMRFSNSVLDTDFKSSKFCESCSSQLAKIGIMV
ncbi:MAG: archemetzincin [Candidatus Methanomethylicota archaeon]|uniref:Archaemetzincin n=1 Tax=Thermoproteota archaeon TaxID=2056631 RepID=A0A497ERM0_9CREN|nr:MAG: archemetzincin [Candidatus Verstraetearchaeota archaeon]